jgi:hypothetical protein
MTTEMNENMIELRQVRNEHAPKPWVELEADVLEFRRPTPAIPVAPAAATTEPLCPHCWTLNAIAAAMTGSVAIGVDSKEILDRVYTVLDELGCLPPPPAAGRRS